MPWNRCAAVGCFGPDVELVESVPLCAGHRAAVAAALGAAPSSLVYYLTWDGGQTVKIGTTSNPAARFKDHAVNGEVTVLAAHPGGRQEERVQHRRFRHLLLDGGLEVFINGPELRGHLDNVRAAWPDWEAMADRVSELARQGRKTA